MLTGEMVAPTRAAVRLDATVKLYRLYDIAYAIDLERVAGLVGAATRGRARPQRLDARALEIRNPPLVVFLAEQPVVVGAVSHVATLNARLFDFGVCSLELCISVPRAMAWGDFVAFAAAVDASPDVPEIFRRELDALVARIEPALMRAAVAPVVEEYKIYRVDHVQRSDTMAAGDACAADEFPDAAVAALLVNEERAVSREALAELVPYRFSYYDDDLVVLTWESALVVEPRAADRDVELLLEFANAQLLELRLFDQQLDADLPLLYDRVAAARSRISVTGRFRGVLSDLQTRVADVTETAERVENALKVTNDVYLARIYSASLALFREQAWRRGVDRKLGILRETYAMLNSEAQAGRMELLELVVVLLIVAELVVALLFHP